MHAFLMDEVNRRKLNSTAQTSFMVYNNKFPKMLPANNRQLHIEETIFLEKYICLNPWILETKI